MTPHPKKFHVALIALLAAFALAAPLLHAQSMPSALSPSAGALADGPEEYEEEYQILGTIEGGQYVSPTGAFRVTIPIIPELGGQINDTRNVVTFQDAFGEHVSIGVFPMTDDLRAEETKRGGRKEFLVWFFQNFIQADFMRSLPDTTTEPNAKYINATQGGTLFTQLLLPNGSVYADRVFIFPPNPPHVAKRGNFVFINNDNIYVISTELSDRIFEYSTYKKTPTEEEEILRKRLNDILAHITFARPGAGATPPGAGPVNIAPAPAPSATTSEMPAITFPGSATNSGTTLK